MTQPKRHSQVGDIGLGFGASECGITEVQRILGRIVRYADEGDPRVSGTLLNAIRESKEVAAEYYRAWAEVLSKVLPRIDWSKPFYINYDREPERYADQHDFYEREVAPYLGEYDKLREVMARVNAGVLSEAEGREEVRANALAAHGGDRKSGSVRVDQATNSRLIYGTTATYTLARLDRDRPDLADRVRREAAEVAAGTRSQREALSANAAAIAAGFRERMVSIPADPARMADVIVRRYPDAARIIRG